MSNEKYIWTKEQEIELERFGDFMATMFEKYGNEIFSKDGQGAEDSALVLIFLWMRQFVISWKMRYNLLMMEQYKRKGRELYGEQTKEVLHLFEGIYDYAGRGL